MTSWIRFLYPDFGRITLINSVTLVYLIASKVSSLKTGLELSKLSNILSRMKDLMYYMLYVLVIYMLMFSVNSVTL